MSTIQNQLAKAVEHLAALVEKLGGVALVNNHITTAGVPPTVAAGAGAGSGAPSPQLTGANDIRGRLTFGSGSAPAAGVMATVTLAKPYDAAPVVVLTPLNAATAGKAPHLGAVTASGFEVSFGQAADAAQAATVYAVNYIVLG